MKMFRRPEGAPQVLSVLLQLIEVDEGVRLAYLAHKKQCSPRTLH